MRIHVPDTHAATPMAYLMSTHAVEIARAGADFSKAVYVHSTFSLREFEAARVRTAQINGCVMCKAWRSARDVPTYLDSLGAPGHTSVISNGPAPDEAFYLNVAKWRDSDIFTERERVAIEYAELMGLDPDGLAFNDAFWSRAKAVFSDSEVVEMAFSIGSWIGLGRLIHVLGLDGASACQIG